jgi:hypothetical protein
MKRVAVFVFALVAGSVAFILYVLAVPFVALFGFLSGSPNHAWSWRVTDDGPLTSMKGEILQEKFSESAAYALSLRTGMRLKKVRGTKQPARKDSPSA